MSVMTHLKLEKRIVLSSTILLSSKKILIFPLASGYLFISLIIFYFFKFFGLSLSFWPFVQFILYYKYYQYLSSYLKFMTKSYSKINYIY